MPAVLAAVALAALYLLLDPPSADLAAQTYRAELFEREGWVAWDNGWYGGHHMPGYSVLSPALDALLGLQVAAALTIVVAAAGSALLMRRWAPRPGADGAAVWLTVAVAALVVSGRLAFALGVAVGVWGLLAAARGARGAAAAGGVATVLASPVAGLFAALVAAAAWWGARGAARGDRRGAPFLLAGVLATAALLALVFPEPGSGPFAASAFWPALAATLAAAALTRGGARAGALLYALLLGAAALLDTPLGGVATRLGALAGGALALALLWPRRRALALLAGVPLAYWAVYPAVRDWSQASGDPARAASYYAPLLARLRGEGRLEIAFTAGHWEAARVAPRVMLARGWLRQLDREVNAVFYDGTLTARRYEAWLRDNAVRWVALPDAPLDPSAEAEARLIRGGLPYLRQTWRGEHWTLYAVRRPTPLNATRVGPDAFTTRGGLVRLRWTPHWAVVAGRGCVRAGPGGWTVVEPRPGGSEVRVGIVVAPLRALSDSPRCR